MIYRIRGTPGRRRYRCARELGPPVISPELATISAFTGKIDTGGVEDVFANAAHVVEEEFHFGRHTAVTLEPRAIIADYDPSERRADGPSCDADALSVPGPLFAPLRHSGSPGAGDRAGYRRFVRHEASCLPRGHGGGRPQHHAGPPGQVCGRSHRVVRLGHSCERIIASGRAWRRMPRRNNSRHGRGRCDRDRRLLAYPRTSVVEGNQVYPADGRALPFRNYRADLQVVFQNKVQMSQYRAVGHPDRLRRHRTARRHVAGKTGRDLRDARAAT